MYRKDDIKKIVRNKETPPEFVAIELWLDLALTNAILFFLIKYFCKKIKKTILSIIEVIIRPNSTL